LFFSHFTDEPEEHWLEEDDIKTGKNDRSAKYELGVKSKNVLLRNGYDVTFQDFNRGHSMSSEIAARVVKWLQQ